MSDEQAAALMAALERIERKLDVIAEQTCPVCGPRLTAKIHPELGQEPPQAEKA